MATKSQPANGPADDTVDSSKPPEIALVSEIPFTTKCVHCGNTVSTNVEYKIGPFTWIACLMIASFGFFLGCCAAPFCIKSAKDIVHTCPDCEEEIGRNSRF